MVLTSHICTYVSLKVMGVLTKDKAVEYLLQAQEEKSAADAAAILAESGEGGTAETA